MLKESDCELQNRLTRNIASISLIEGDIWLEANIFLLVGNMWSSKRLPSRPPKPFMGGDTNTLYEMTLLLTKNTLPHPRISYEPCPLDSWLSGVTDCIIKRTLTDTWPTQWISLTLAYYGDYGMAKLIIPYLWLSYKYTYKKLKNNNKQTDPILHTNWPIRGEISEILRGRWLHSRRAKLGSQAVDPRSTLTYCKDHNQPRPLFKKQWQTYTWDRHIRRQEGYRPQW